MKALRFIIFRPGDRFAPGNYKEPRLAVHVPPKPHAVLEKRMDIVITGIIILIIGLAVAPFFLLSGAFGAPKRRQEDVAGPMTPVPMAGEGDMFPHRRDDSSDDSDGDDDGDGGERPDSAV